MSNDRKLAIGLMSGTSMDGVDAAVIETDGRAYVKSLGAIECLYDALFRDRLRATLGGNGEVPTVERDLTLLHRNAVQALCGKTGIKLSDVDIIGFHGHTILHKPERGWSWQIGDGELLASKTGVDVVADFRTNDLDSGGEGAPLAPVYHRALTSNMERPVAVLNLGGVGNVTWIGPGEDEIIGFDTGPGNALLDDWTRQHSNDIMDRDGFLSSSGNIDEERLSALLAHRYLDRQPPKSLDRDDFNRFVAPFVEDLSPADGAALLAAFTVGCVARAAQHFPDPARRWIVTGGGRSNPTIMGGLRNRFDADVLSAEDVGWDGSALEAEAFAYMAVRSCLGLPLSFPGTTGVREPVTGGVLCKAGGDEG